MTIDATKTCLLLEDDFVLRSHVEMQLRSLGVACVAAFAASDEALAFLSNSKPGFAVVDYRLGRLRTSESVLHELLRQAVPTVIVTGLGELPDEAQGLADVPVLEKPVQADALGPHLAKAGLIPG